MQAVVTEDVEAYGSVTWEPKSLMSESARDRFTRLFLENGATLCRRMRRLVASSADVDDVVQEAFLRAYENADTVRVPGAFVFSAARNLAFDQRRHERRKAELEQIAGREDSSVEPIDAQLLSEERARLLREAVERLPPQCRTVFALKVFQDRSYKEIADQLGICVKTVENHVARGLREIHHYLRARYDGCGEVSDD